MGILGIEFAIPKRLIADEKTLTDVYGRFVAEPFERGFGWTLGNSLRRILLSSVEGTAVTTIKIDNVQHEFSSIPGVVEDLSEIVLNIKKLVLRSNTRNPKSIYLKISKKGDVKAKHITTSEGVEIINPDLHIATLTKDVKLNIEMELARGRGYMSAERNKKERQPIGVIAIDSIFTPVIKVEYNVEDTRVGQMTDYDKLVMDITTNGAITPVEAMLYASNIMQRHMDIFVNYGQLPEIEEEEESKEEEELLEKLKMPVTELELSVRSSNCLREAKIKTIGELVKKTELEMLKYRNFGKKSLTEIGNMVKEMGLEFGMKMPPKEKKEEE